MELLFSTLVPVIIYSGLIILPSLPHLRLIDMLVFFFLSRRMCTVAVVVEHGHEALGDGTDTQSLVPQAMPAGANLWYCLLWLWVPDASISSSNCLVPLSAIFGFPYKFLLE